MENKNRFRKFKVIIVGDGNVGKTTYIKRLLTGEFTEKYIATLGVEVHPIRFNTTSGPVCFNMWDCAGQEKFGGLRDGYYIQADAVIFMYSTPKSLKNLNDRNWVRDVRRVTRDIPFIICKSKCDATDYYNYDKLPFLADCIDISTKEYVNLYKPVEYLMKQLVGEEVELIPFSSDLLSTNVNNK